MKYFFAKDNPMFPPELTALLRFVRLDKAEPCPACKKKGKKRWTMLVPFHATTPSGFVLSKGPELPALTPVCEDHPLAPAESFTQAIGCLEEAEVQ
jgi:hypothetical protein